MNRQDRYRGCLVGGGAGDALGYAVELRNSAARASRNMRCAAARRRSRTTRR